MGLRLITHDPVKAQVVVVNIGLQTAKSIRDLPAHIGLNMLIALRLWQAVLVSG
jgi:hypothetical protein